MKRLASLRTIRIVTYGLLLVAGGVLLNQIAITPGLPKVVWYGVTVWMIIGSLACLLGQFRAKWTGEFVGLPLISSALLAFGVLQAALGHWSLGTVPGTSIIWAFALVLGDRWNDTRIMYKSSERAS